MAHRGSSPSRRTSRRDCSDTEAADGLTSAHDPLSNRGTILPSAWRRSSMRHVGVSRFRWFPVIAVIAACTANSNPGGGGFDDVPGGGDGRADAGDGRVTTDGPGLDVGRDAVPAGDVASEAVTPLDITTPPDVAPDAPPRTPRSTAAPRTSTPTTTASPTPRSAASAPTPSTPTPTATGRSTGRRSGTRGGASRRARRRSAARRRAARWTPSA